MKKHIEVRVGQIWADNDKRSQGRRLRVVAIEPAVPATPHHRAVPERAVVRDINEAPHKGFTRVRLDRFRPTSNGYRLIKDVDA